MNVSSLLKGVPQDYSLIMLWCIRLNHFHNFLQINKENKTHYLEYIFNRDLMK